MGGEEIIFWLTDVHMIKNPDSGSKQMLWLLNPLHIDK